MTDYVTREELDRALPDVPVASKNGTKVEMMCSRPDRIQREFPEVLKFTVDGGIEGDYEMDKPWLKLPDGSPDPRIQVSIISRRMLDLVRLDRENTTHPGDAIATDLDMTHENLPVGSRLKVGTAVVEISDVWNDGCAKWKVRMDRPANDWISAPEHESLRLRGIYCRIVGDGEVWLNDTITKI